MKNIKRKNEQQKQVVGIARQVTHMGPLPAPTDFQRYDEILPGAAERILTMAEKEQSHRHETTAKMMEKEFGLVKLGLIFAFSVSIVIPLITGILVYLTNETTWTVALIAEISGLAGLFVYWSRKPKKIKEKKPE